MGGLLTLTQKSAFSAAPDKLTAMPTLLAEIDTQALDDLRDTLGPLRARQLLVDFLRDTHTRMARMQALADHPNAADGPGLIKDAHDLSGNAGSFGLARLGDLAAVVQSAAAAHDKIALHGAMANLVECAKVDLNRLAEWASQTPADIARNETQRTV